MRVSSSLLLLLSFVSAAAGQGLGPFDAPPIDGSIADPEDPTEPVVHSVDITNNLVVSYSSDEGLSNIASHVEESKRKGRSVSLRAGAGQRYSRKVKKGGRGSRNKGASGRSSPSGGGAPSKKGNEQKKRNKGKKGGRSGGRRFLQSEDEEETAGYAVLDVGSELEAEAEMYELIGISGVTMVEQDVEYVVEEVANLRGAAQEMQEIMDSVTHMEERRLQQGPETTPWGIDMVNITHLWSLPPAQHVKICVIDTGYDLGHEDLPDNVTYPVTGWDTGNAAKGVWHIDGHSHGTHCAGTIGAIGGNQAGVVGVNPDPARFSFHIGKGLSDSGSGSGSDVVNAVKDCVDNGAHVISMSLGCSNCYVQAYDEIYREAYDDGALIIAAAGNSYSDVAHYPSGYESVVSVASVTQGGGPHTANYGELSSFSTRNDQTEIAAPGSYVNSTVLDNKYARKSGTSMAAPHVAGVAAWLVSHFPSCTNNQIRNAMIHSTREPPTGDYRNSKGWDKFYGWGIVNAGRAYELLLLGCESAGGAYPAVNQTLSDMAQGGKDQKDIGCTSDFQCTDENMCNGIRKCDLSTNTCYIEEGTEVVCDDGLICTTDTCDSNTGTCSFTPVNCEDGNKCNGIKACNNVTGACDLVEDPVSCDDGDACTIDKCITSTGQCQITDRVCNDGNTCTLNDSCNSNTGCIFEDPQPDCCGNAVCEPSETEQTCPLDCSTSITTDISASRNPYGYLGNYFDVHAKSYNDIVITGLSVNCILPPEKAATAYVWARTGSFYKDENGSSVWYRRDKFTLYQTSSIVCSGQVGQLTNITLNGDAGNIQINAGTVAGFNVYILTDDTYNDYPMVRAGYGYGGFDGVNAEDSYLSIRNGGGNACTSGWCSMGRPIRFSGSLFYAVLDGSSSSTAAPPGEDDTSTTTTTATTTTTSTTTTDGTAAPSFSPIPTQSPSKSPTNLPSMRPTPPPTSNPSGSPTETPSKFPTESPTPAPTLSLSPTEFVPEVVELLSESSRSATVLRAAYFEVTTGAEWAKIVNLKIWTYKTKGLQVYVKDGEATNYEQVPCSWKRIAETSANWNPGYWKKVYPPWVDGFDPVVMEPYSKKSFYVVNLSPGYGILGTRTSSSNPNKYHKAHLVSPLESPVSNVTLSFGRGGYNDPFRVYNSYYSPYGIFGGLKMESVQPGTTHTPTASPTAPSEPDNVLESFHDVTASSLTPHGIQFDVKNIGGQNLFVTDFKLHLAGTGMKSVEVWMRTGSHHGVTGNCKNYNNWCKQWKRLASGNVSSSGHSMTTTPKFVAVVPVGEIVSFVLVSGDSGIVTRKSIPGDTAAENDHLSLGFGTKINDYYGDNVQTSETPDEDNVIFHGTMTYTIAYGDCAILSTASWVDPHPDSSGMSSASSFSNADDEEESGPQTEERVYWSDSFEDEEPPLLGGGPVNDDGTGPMISSIQEIVE